MDAKGDLEQASTMASHRPDQPKSGRSAGDVDRPRTGGWSALQNNSSDENRSERSEASPQRIAEHISTELVTSFGYKKRKRGRCGRATREAPGLESAITAAIRRAPTRPSGQAIFRPSVGLSFNSREEAKEFYNLYSWEIGFGVRYARSDSNKNGYQMNQDIVCSCEGWDSKGNTRSCRKGCRASIRLLRSDDDGWFISRFIEEHNHELSASCSENKQWNSHGEIDGVTKDFIKKLRENNVSLGKVCNIIGVNGANPCNRVRKEAVRSLCAKLAQDNIKDDMVKTVDLINTMQTSDPAMQVRHKLDNEGRIKSMIWCTGNNILDYKRFGDVVTFDTTYRTNLYNLPFGLFVGVNNHFQSIIFGGVLLTTEKTKDFEWAFKSFISIMGDAAPVTILTDQCLAMKKAIKTTMPNTRHRWCRWHVLRKAKLKLGSIYTKYGGFKREFHKLITDEICKEKFEDQWERLLIKYGIRNNKFMCRIFKHRNLWAKPYFMDVFCAGMTSTQRSESANHMLKTYIQKSAPMHMFVQKFNEFQFDRKDQEGKEEHATRQKSRHLRVGVPIERHARDVYTRAMFEKFKMELFESGSFAIDQKPSDNEYILTNTLHDGRVGIPKTKVTLDEAGSRVRCECGLYEHMGLLCRHALKVLVHLDKRQIPAGNIMERWTPTSTTDVIAPTGLHLTVPTSTEQISMIQRSILVNKALEIANDSNIDESAMLKAIEIMDAARTALAQCSVSPRPHDSARCDQITTMKCPERTIKKGRPANTSLASWNNSLKNKRKTKGTKLSGGSSDSPDEENPKGWKTRMLHDFIN